MDSNASYFDSMLNLIVWQRKESFYKLLRKVDRKHLNFNAAFSSGYDEKLNAISKIGISCFTLCKIDFHWCAVFPAASLQRPSFLESNPKYLLAALYAFSVINSCWKFRYINYALFGNHASRLLLNTIDEKGRKTLHYKLPSE